MVRVVFEKRQPPQTDTGDLADHDLAYLLDYLETVEGQRFRMSSRPDVEIRTSPAPDYLLQEVETGALLAVERVQLLEQERQAAVARLLRRGADVIIHEVVEVDLRTLALAVTELVCAKLKKGQLQGVRADRRILLARSRIIGGVRPYLKAPIALPTDCRATVDNVFVIVSRQLVEL